MTTQELSKLKTFLSKPRKIAIIMHKSPDGDAIGSSLGMYHFLNSFKHKISVISPNAYPEFLKWMPGTKLVLDYSKKAAPALAAIRAAELIICLDFNSLKRIEELGKEVSKSKALKLLIDHHPQPEDFADFALHTINASSTAELVFDFIELMGEKKKINKNIANCLYAGIMTDTGSFRFSSTTIRTHNVTAELMEHGAETTKVHHLIDDNNRESRMRLFGFALVEKMKIFPEYGTGFIALTQSDLKRFDYHDGDTEGLVNQPLSIKGIVFSALFTEKADEDGIKISFRSKNTFNVNLFARAHFNGGGHLNAAGGSSDLSMDETIMKFLQLLGTYREQLQAE
ncbi:MAG TPA: bifunctional oligoribonuclease/PAP phosphatase NrnA [Bacteroidia bacterium]|nr:bifunctional oligoribonuclease/PAP phosphatase NrnA [Bacteroidia bacterium]